LYDHDDAQSHDDDDDSAGILEAILGRGGQCEDVSYEDDGVDVSLDVDVGAVVGVGVGVNGQSVSLSVGLGVGLVVGSTPITSLDSSGAHLRPGSLMTSNTICPLDEVIPLINSFSLSLWLLFNSGCNVTAGGKS